MLVCHRSALVKQPQATPPGLTISFDWLCFGVAPKSTASQSSFGSLLSLHLSVVCNCIIKMQTAVSALTEKDKHVHDGGRELHPALSPGVRTSLRWLWTSLLCEKKWTGPAGSYLNFVLFKPGFLKCGTSNRGPWVRGTGRQWEGGWGSQRVV